MSITIPINITKRARLDRVFAKTEDGVGVPTTSSQIDVILTAWLERQIDKEIERRELRSLIDQADTSLAAQRVLLLAELQAEDWGS